MPGPDPSFYAPLRAAYEAARRVRTPEDLDAVLEGIAELVAEQLGWGGVVLNTHRRAWDDFEASIVRGSDESRSVLLGTAQSWTQWAPLFRERFEHRGAYFVPAESEQVADVVMVIPDIEVTGAVGAWHPSDMLLVLMRGSDGEVAGILSVDEPRSGQRPTDEEIDALVIVANAAGGALQQAREAADSARHQNALQQLLAVSTKLSDARSDADLLDTVCAGIRDALGFERVAIELADGDGLLVTRAWTGWDEAPRVPLDITGIARVMQTEFEEQGCYLLDRVDALRLLDLPGWHYASEHNGRGPWAWSRHWLMVPLRDPEGAVTGFIWADEPTDRLLPDTPRLQALRLFADQAQAALEAARHYEQAVYLAAHDPLTGLPNRAVFLDRLRHALLRARRANRTLAVLFVDIDRFKTVNDTHGHEAGDEVLRTVAARIDGSLRPGDTVARLGGDEFVVLCEDIYGEADALEVARRLRALLAEPIAAGTSVLSLTASVGVALPDTSGEDAGELLRFADVAMYRAKAAGRDGQEVASHAVRADASSRAQLESALSGALDRDEIHVRWQPVVSLSTGTVVRTEALMRWTHPDLGDVGPLEFIPLAEDNGAIIALGRFVLDRACAQWAQWRTELGHDSPAIAVNLSPSQLRDPCLLEQISDLQTQHDMPAGALTVEITEGALLDATPGTIQALAGLRALGCPIELDDFGTGFSSLSSLAEFNVDGLKIDRSFISGHGSASRGAAIAQAVLAMAGALGLRATAEGVETPEQLAWLRSHGCLEAQGYLFSRPVTATDLTTLLLAPEPLLAAASAAASAL